MDITLHEDPVRTTDVHDFVLQVKDAVGERPLAIAITDLDDFAAINTRFGHDAGDAVLSTWERTLRASLPNDAIVARISGDEYAVALPALSSESALIMLEEVRSHFASHPVPGVDHGLDSSIGIASRPPHGERVEDLTRCAAEALMRAKREGRGRVVIYVEEKMTLKSNYYSRAALDRLTKLSAATSRTEASLLREALDDLVQKYRSHL